MEKLQYLGIFMSHAVIGFLDLRNWHSKFVFFSGPPCGSHQFDCGDGCCVDMVDKCDGTWDCLYNAFDEDASVCGKLK